MNWSDPNIEDMLRAALVPLAAEIECAFVFGSFARGEEHRDSDVDLMLVGDVAFADVARALILPQLQLGREINPTVYTPGDLAVKMSARHHFLTQVLAGPKIFLLGNESGFSRHFITRRLINADEHSLIRH